MERISEGIQDYFDSYDWDKKFIDHFGEWEQNYLTTTLTTTPAVSLRPNSNP